MFWNEIKSECIVTDEGEGILEIKNIATKPAYQGRVYGKIIIEFIVKTYQDHYTVLQVGAGYRPSTIPFYAQCGFSRPHRIANFLLIIITTTYMKMAFNW